jgi:hypothetical protein
MSFLSVLRVSPELVLHCRFQNGLQGFLSHSLYLILYPCELRFSDKNQKAIDLLRTRCLKLKSLVLCDGRLYEIMRGNFERADRR